MTEKELIVLLKRGDESAFKYLIDTMKDMVFNTVLGLVQNFEDAEDVAQEVFIVVYQSVHDFKSESKISTWVYKITINKSLDFLKRKKRKKRFAFIESIWDKNKELKFDPIEFYHPGMQAENKEDAALIFKCIQELPEMQKVVFLLYKLENLSYEEIGKVIDKSESAVNSIMHRAKENLKACLMKRIS